MGKGFDAGDPRTKGKRYVLVGNFKIVKEYGDICEGLWLVITDNGGCGITVKEMKCDTFKLVVGNRGFDIFKINAMAESCTILEVCAICRRGNQLYTPCVIL